ncbi:MAG: biotin/lipoyl-containing protein [Anaerolineae bacterium]|jgi:biotin carboxyl carrier protein
MSREFSLTLDGTTYKIVADGNSVLVNGIPFVIGFEPGGGRILVDGIAYELEINEQSDRALVRGISHDLSVEGLEGTRPGPRRGAATVAGEGAVTAIMPGKIIRLLVAEGDQVQEGDVICILEAMKMENELKAPRSGMVKALYVQTGQDVEMGSVLAEIDQEQA